MLYRWSTETESLRRVQRRVVFDQFDPLSSDPSRCCCRLEWRHLFQFALPVNSLSRPARLCLSSDEIPIGSVKGSGRSSGNPRSRSCRVVGVWVAYGVQYAESAGVNCLPGGQSSEKKGSTHAHTEYRSDEVRPFLGVFEKRSLEELGGCWPAQTRCQCLADLQEEGKCEPEGRVLHQATLHDFLKRSRVFVHAAIAIEGRWRGFHAVNKQTISSSSITQ